MSRNRQLPRDSRVPVTELDAEGAGFGEVDGFQLRVKGALPGETVTVRVTKRRRRKLEALAETVADASPLRITPDCPMAGRCGGCTLQHLDPAEQRAFKRGRLAALFAEAGLTPDAWLEDLVGPTRGYRHKARLGVRYVTGKGGALVGFRERGGGRVAELDACRVLAPVIGERLGALRVLITGLEAAASIPQIEVAVGDDAAALVFRHLEALSEADLGALRRFGEATGLHVYLQPGGLPTTARLWPGPGPQASPETGPETGPEAGPETEGERLHYWPLGVPEAGVDSPPSPTAPRLAFHPQDFMQVNPAINRAMVARTLDLLAPTPADRVLDLFCGLGNFTLPLAGRAGGVHGVEGSEALVERARENAAANGLDNATFAAADLYDASFDVGELPQADLLLLDPPRTGAERICAGIGRLAPRRIVYVSCKPETLARDAALLVAAGYGLSAAGILDMFPHTAHVESMAVFDLQDGRGGDMDVATGELENRGSEIQGSETQGSETQGSETRGSETRGMGAGAW